MHDDPGVLFIFPIPDTSKPTKEKVVKNGKEKHTQKKKSEQLKGEPGKKKSFTHPWLCRSMIFHKSAILDMDISPSSKYIATCSQGKLSV